MITIYGGDNCNWCKKAVKLAQKCDATFEYFDVALVENQKSFRKLFPDAKTIPQIQYNGEHIGGYDKFNEFTKNKWGVFDER